MGFSIEAKFYILSFTFLCTALVVYADPSKFCPPSKIIEPCTCHSICTPQEVWCVSVVCDDLNDQQVLTNVFTSEYQFAYFTLKQASVLYLPDSLFQVVRLNRLTIHESSFVDLFNYTETRKNSVAFVSLDKVQVQRGFDWKMLSGFQRLLSLEIIKTKVPRIDQSFIDHASNFLERLVLDDSSTTTIHDTAFAKLTDLRRLSVRDGRIRELKRSMFATPSYIKRLDLSGNLLSSLPDDMFSEMPYLEDIIFSRNLFTEISENVFRNVFLRLQTFHIEGNPLKCQCNICWITHATMPRHCLGSCLEPKILHGKQIQDLVPGDFSHCA